MCIQYYDKEYLVSSMGRMWGPFVCCITLPLLLLPTLSHSQNICHRIKNYLKKKIIAEIYLGIFYMCAAERRDVSLSSLSGKYCIRTLPRGGTYWEIHPPRPKRFPEGGDFAPRGPRDCPRAISRAECRVRLILSVLKSILPC